MARRKRRPDLLLWFWLREGSHIIARREVTRGALYCISYYRQLGCMESDVAAATMASSSSASSALSAPDPVPTEAPAPATVQPPGQDPTHTPVPPPPPPPPAEAVQTGNDTSQCSTTLAQAQNVPAESAAASTAVAAAPLPTKQMHGGNEAESLANPTLQQVGGGCGAPSVESREAYLHVCTISRRTCMRCKGASPLFGTGHVHPLPIHSRLTLSSRIIARPPQPTPRPPLLAPRFLPSRPHDRCPNPPTCFSSTKPLRAANWSRRNTLSD